METLGNRQLSPAAREGARAALGDNYDITAAMTVAMGTDDGGDGDDNADATSNANSCEAKIGVSARAMSNAEIVKTVALLVLSGLELLSILLKFELNFYHFTWSHCIHEVLNINVKTQVCAPMCRVISTR